MICPPIVFWLNNADLCSAVNIAVAVNVFSRVVTLVPPECTIDVASTRVNPPVVISPTSAVSPTAGSVASSDTAIALPPLVPADVLV